MNYATILEKLSAAIPSSQCVGLEVAHALDKALNHPTSAYPTIHIAGSNGKGSVTSKIAQALQLSGYRVGLYTSPHLFSYRERITINGEQISEEAVVEGVEKIEALGLNPTFFELTTYLAFDYFRAQKVDIAVIETGLGGKWDATNTIKPLLTVITSISREHTHLLGDTIEQIAAEKAGILKENVPLVLGPKARAQAIYDRANKLSCPLFASKKISYFYDEENTAIAELALEQLVSHFTLTAEAIKEGLAFRPPCRFERIGNVLFDVAHNPDAVFYLLQALHTFYPQNKCRFVVAFSKDKEYGACLGLIADVASHIHLVQFSSPRAASVEELKESLKEENPTLFTAHSSIEEGVTLAYAEAQAKGEILVICGSFYIMGEAKQTLISQAPSFLASNGRTLPSALSSSRT